jgi:hypothetical protein
MLTADLFVILDHVQFERRNYQNRTLIRIEDEAQVAHGARGAALAEGKDRRQDGRQPADLSGTRVVGPEQLQHLKYAYRKAPHFDAYASALREIFEARWDKLLDLDMATLDFIRGHLGIDTPIIRSSTLDVTGQRSGLLLDICRNVGASAFLGGMGGSRDYLEHEAFAAAGMGVQWQEFSHPVYPQPGAAPFIKGLSALDLLFNCGPRSAEILRARSAAKSDELLAAA